MGRSRAQRAAGTAAAPLLVTLLALSIPTVAAAPLAAQDAHGLSFVAGVGYEMGGPGPHLVEQFEEAGLDEDRPEKCAVFHCDPAVPYAFHVNEGIGLTFLAGVRYRTRGLLSIEALVSNGVWGHAAGNSESQGENLEVFYGPLVLSTELGVHLGPLRLAAGPALNRTTWRITRNASPGGDVTRSLALGLGGSASLEVRARGVAISGRVQARAFRDVDIPTSLLALDGRYRSIVFALSVHPLPGTL